MEINRKQGVVSNQRTIRRGNRVYDTGRGVGVARAGRCFERFARGE